MKVDRYLKLKNTVGRTRQYCMLCAHPQFKKKIFLTLPKKILFDCRQRYHFFTLFSIVAYDFIHTHRS